jgi:Protein of unknown function (DUF2490)
MSSLIRILLPVICLPLFPIATVVFGQSTSPPRADTQVWSEVQVAIPINKQTDIVLLGNMRLGRNVRRLVYELIGAGVSLKVGKYLTLFPFYLHVASQPTSTNHNTEERLTLEATAKFPLRSFTISDRHRVEFHFHSPPPNFTRYRNRLQIAHPFRFHKSEFEGFIADEVFYDSLASAWIRNRMYAGIAKKFTGHFTLELYYVRQNDSHSHPGDIHAIGTTLKFHL